MPFIFFSFYRFFLFNFPLRNWTNLLVNALIHSFVHADVWSTKIHEKLQGHQSSLFLTLYRKHKTLDIGATWQYSLVASPEALSIA